MEVVGEFFHLLDRKAGGLESTLDDFLEDAEIGWKGCEYGGRVGHCHGRADGECVAVGYIHDFDVSLPWFCSNINSK